MLFQRSFSARLRQSCKFLDRLSTQNTCRCLSQEARTSYIDEWFESIVKEESFYEYHGDSKPRRYFYNVDLQGRLFLEETLPKNIATSIKDNRFLDFFFRNVKPVGPKEKNLMEQCGISTDEYPFVSICAGEFNFIRPAATPIVFHTLDRTDNTLLYAGSRTQEFQMSDLAISEETGRLYHRSDHLEKVSAKTKAQEDQNGALSSPSHCPFALVRSAVVVSFSDCIVPMSEEEIRAENKSVSLQNYSGLAFLHENDRPKLIPWLPKEAEPGSWAMPYSEDSPE